MLLHALESARHIGRGWPRAFIQAGYSPCLLLDYTHNFPIKITQVDGTVPNKYTIMKLKLLCIV